ncbi:MAG: C25 family cysteine peptidase [Caldilineaceae bacterium]
MFSQVYLRKLIDPNKYVHRLLALMVIWATLLALTLTPSQPAHAAPLTQQPDPTQGKAPVVTIVQSDNRVFKATIQFPAPTAWPVKPGDGNTYTQMSISGVESQTVAPGKPDVPIYRRLLGVPQGAQVRLVNVTPHVSRIATGLLYPAQPSPVDQGGEDPNPDPAFQNPPFTRDAQAYASDQDFPALPAHVTRIGRMRDLDEVLVEIATGQYNAAAHTLKLFDQVQIEVAFEGGAGYFLPAAATNPFEVPNRYDLVLNHFEINQYIDPGSIHWLCIGDEYLIITDPAFRAAADALKVWKEAKGISTRVVETGSDPGDAGTTNTAIQTYIRNQYNNCLVRPSYALLLGDAEFIPVFTHTLSSGVIAGTDLDYALIDNTDLLPDLAVGRMPVDTLTDAQTIVTKTINYEQHPPTDANFYKNMSFASYFQCCRTDVTNDGTDMRSFVETAELARDQMLTEGYTVERIYTANASNNITYTNNGGDPTPRRYYDGSLLPADLGASSGFAWAGNTTDIINAFNAGRFLILHRDHGSRNGWGSPSFSVSNMSSLTNTVETPIVYSVNCASGIFDNETNGGANGTTTTGVYWAEQLIRQRAGAVGVIGDTRNSPTWANSALTRGLFDATWPDVLPADGGSTSIKRLGDILNYGKEYLVSQVGVAQTAGSVTSDDADTDVILYHVFGDPTLEMWTKNPHRLTLPGYFTYTIPFTRTIDIRYPINGAVVTALQGGNPVARGAVVNGQARLTAIAKFDPQQRFEVSVSHPDAISRRLRPAHALGQIKGGQGGALTDAASRFAIHFPPGATQQDLDLSYSTQLSPTLPLLNNLNALRSFVLDAADANGNVVNHFAQAYTMNLNYTDEELAQTSADEQSLRCVYLNETNNQWQPVTSTVDAASNTVTCQADHFTEFALVAGKASNGGSEQEAIYLPLVQR